MNEFLEHKNILVYRIGHLGDTIVALPAFWEIRKKYPNSKITLLTNSDSKNKNYVMAKSVLPQTGLFDDYLTYDNSEGKLQKIRSYLKLLLTLKLKKFDCLFYLSTRNRSLSQIERDRKFFDIAGIQNIYGTENLKKNQLQFQEPRPLPVVIPEYRFLLDCLPFKSADNKNQVNHNLNLTDTEKKKAELWLEKNCGANYKLEKLIALAPGSKWTSKLWAEEKYITVLKKIIEKYKAYPVIFGGQEDFDTGQRIIDAVLKGANAAGSLNVRESSAALEKCVFYLGNDTGTMHMAAAVGIPCVAIFAATDYRGRWFPFGENNKIFRISVECEGCHTPICFNQNKCLELISEEEVFEACCSFLER